MKNQPLDFQGFFPHSLFYFYWANEDNFVFWIILKKWKCKTFLNVFRIVHFKPKRKEKSETIMIFTVLSVVQQILPSWSL